MEGKKDLIEYASSITSLVKKRKGDETYYVGQCPLHADTEPSFVVYPNDGPDTAICVCFACHPAAMDIIELYKLYNKVSYAEAVANVVGKVTPLDVLVKKTDRSRAKKMSTSAQDVYGLYVAAKLFNLYRSKDIERVDRLAKIIDEILGDGANIHKITKLINEFK